MPYPLGRHAQCLGETTRAGPVAFQQMKRHALGRLGADARQAAQGRNQLPDQAVIGHQNGILKPGGSPIPVVMPDIFSWVRFSI